MKGLIIIILLALTGCCETSSEEPISTTTASPQNPIQTQPGLPLDRWTGGLRKIWEPAIPLKGYFILHQGHSAWDGSSPSGREYDYPEYNLTPVAEQLAAAGYRVYGFEMPPLPHNVGPVERFYQPVIALLDRIAGDGYPVYMAGLSGGGWTTTHVTALDQRITKGYSVQGDAPSDLRPIDLPQWDEETHPVYDYRTLYAMAGNRLLHIDGGAFFHWQGDIGYPYINDESTHLHTISPWATNYMLNDIKSQRMTRQILLGSLIVIVTLILIFSMRVLLVYRNFYVAQVELTTILRREKEIIDDK